MPSIDKTLVLSTAHFTDDDNIRLCQFAKEHAEAPDTSTHFVANLGYGYLVWVNTDGDFSEYAEDMSEAFIGTLKYAQKHDVQWLRFDRDEPEIEDLPIFAW